MILVNLASSWPAVADGQADADAVTLGNWAQISNDSLDTYADAILGIYKNEVGETSPGEHEEMTCLTSQQNPRNAMMQICYRRTIHAFGREDFHEGQNAGCRRRIDARRERGVRSYGRRADCRLHGRPLRGRISGAVVR